MGTPMGADVSDIAPDVAIANMVPNSVPDTVPDAALNVVANEVPNPVPDAAPDVVADVVLTAAPNEVSIAVPNVMANINPDVGPAPPQATWPVETDIIFVDGTSRVILTSQQPIMRSILQDAFSRVKFALLFNNAFPNAYEILLMSRTALVSAAQSREDASSIHQRLLNDEVYATHLLRLVSYYKCT
jgi:hypothetical protein